MGIEGKNGDRAADVEGSPNIAPFLSRELWISFFFRQRKFFFLAYDVKKTKDKVQTEPFAAFSYFTL